jgi:hypothetical protein
VSKHNFVAFDANDVRVFSLSVVIAYRSPLHTCERKKAAVLSISNGFQFVLFQWG